MKNLTLILAFCLSVPYFTQAQIYIGDTEVDTTTVITGLDVPWEIQWGPDNYIWTTERYGRVSRIHPETGEQDVILDISNEVYQSGESGLLGMILHPDFEEKPLVYMAYTYRPSGQILEKIVSYEYEDGLLKNEIILLDNITGNTTHIGCRMIILPDNTLLFSTGDAQNQPAAQDLQSLNGKFLRLNLDGSIPNDNPFSDNPVYSFGHRNAQGLYLAPNGILYSSEHGPSTDDEFNIVEKGQNYGWPNVHGFCDSPSEEAFCEENNVIEPLVAWTPTVAASDIVYYDHPAIPEWQNHILMTSLKNKRIYDLKLSEDGMTIVEEKQYFQDWWGRLRDICVGPDGAIYLATNGQSWGNSDPFTHSIIKLWNPEYVSISDHPTKTEYNVRVSPNPAKERLYINIDSRVLGDTLMIYSITGALIFKQQLTQTSFEIPLDGFNNGLYSVSIHKKNNIVFSKKISVVRD